MPIRNAPISSSNSLGFSSGRNPSPFRTQPSGTGGRWDYGSASSQSQQPSSSGTGRSFTGGGSNINANVNDRLYGGRSGGVGYGNPANKTYVQGAQPQYTYQQRQYFEYRAREGFTQPRPLPAPSNSVPPSSAISQPTAPPTSPTRSPLNISAGGGLTQSGLPGLIGMIGETLIGGGNLGDLISNPNSFAEQKKTADKAGLDLETFYKLPPGERERLTRERIDQEWQESPFNIFKPPSNSSGGSSAARPWQMPGMPSGLIPWPPGDPRNANEPTSPLNPRNPTSPLNPRNYPPGLPTAPTDPNSLYNPDNPNSPFNLNNPNNPFDPNDPLNPGRPDSPYNPKNPNSPYNPNNPNNPINRPPSDKLDFPKGLQSQPWIVKATLRYESYYKLLTGEEGWEPKTQQTSGGFTGIPLGTEVVRTAISAALYAIYKNSFGATQRQLIGAISFNPTTTRGVGYSVGGLVPQSSPSSDPLPALEPQIQPDPNAPPLGLPSNPPQIQRPPSPTTPPTSIPQKQVQPQIQPTQTPETQPKIPPQGFPELPFIPPNPQQQPQRNQPGIQPQQPGQQQQTKTPSSPLTSPNGFKSPLTPPEERKTPDSGPKFGGGSGEGDGPRGGCRYREDELATVRVQKVQVALNGRQRVEQDLSVHEKFTDFASLHFQQMADIKAGVDRIEKAGKIQRILQTMDTIATLHNAAMLSRNLASTLGDATSTVITAVGRLTGFVDAEQTVDVNEIVQETFDEFMKRSLGEDVWNGTKQNWIKFNRIISTASNIVWSVRSMMDSMQSITEWTAENTGRIGNALKKFGVVGERAYPWMAERVSSQTIWQQKFQRVRDNLESLDDAASSLTGVAGEVISIQDEFQQLNQQKADFQKALEEAQPKPPTENKPNKDVADATKTASSGQDVTDSDLGRNDDAPA